MAKKAGMPSVGSLKFISTTGDIMRKPAKIRAGNVAAIGTILKTGQKNSATRKNRPVNRAVRPVLPPAATPAVLST